MLNILFLVNQVIKYFLYCIFINQHSLSQAILLHYRIQNQIVSKLTGHKKCNFHGVFSSHIQHFS